MDSGSSLFGQKAGRDELLDVISSVKTKLLDVLGVIELPIPQFILVGKQSVGKSRLIEALAGETFNFVSGSLGSRRPTILEFRNVPEYTESRWLILDKTTKSWDTKPTPVVMQHLAQAHESLGTSVSSDPVYVRIESAHCTDIQIVDLPGFRDFSMDENKAKLADQIDDMVNEFMANPRSVMLCVEEAGDAANLSTLTKCRRHDPSFARTILVRNKLDKYYRDLTSDNIDLWMDGFGDLPKKLPKFALTLPNWKDGNVPRESFIELRERADAMDKEKINSMHGSTETIGYNNFAAYFSTRIQRLFADSIVPVLREVSEQKDASIKKLSALRDLVTWSNPTLLATNIREAATSFGRTLAHVMEGVITSASSRYTLLGELQEFHDYYSAMDIDFPLIASPDFLTLEDYVECLENDIQLPSVNVEVNGGAQYRRMICEIDVFMRFAELGDEISEIDLIQGRGVSVHSITWSDVVIKLLSNEAHAPMKARVRYAAERIAFFFKMQKSAMLDFMITIEGTAEEKMYSSMYAKHGMLMKSDPQVLDLIYDAFDNAVDVHKQNFLKLFDHTLTSMFANPWVFLKKTSAQIAARQGVADSINADEDEFGGAVEDNTWEGAKKRVPLEIAARTGVENILNRWLSNIPTEPSKMDTTVDMAQILLLKMFQMMRCNIADMIEVYAESFFKLSMLRRIDKPMSEIQLGVSEDTLTQKHEQIEAEYEDMEKRVKVLETCEQTLKKFRQKQKSAM